MTEKCLDFALTALLFDIHFLIKLKKGIFIHFLKKTLIFVFMKFKSSKTNIYEFRKIQYRI
jgi:hypothetical protein